MRRAAPDELPAVNRIVTGAIASWRLPARVMRLALPHLRYQPHDLDFMQILIANGGSGEPVAIVAWELPPAPDGESSRDELYMHGLYVLPEWQRCGFGDALLSEAVEMARDRGVRTATLHAWRSAENFFAARGFLPDSPAGVYPRRMRKRLLGR